MTMTRPLRRTFSVTRIYLMLATLACSVDNIKVTESGSSTIEGNSELAVLPDLGFSSLQSIDISNNETFKSEGADVDDIDSAKLDSLTITITSPTSGQDLTFIESVKFYASTPDTTKVLIAQGGPFEAGLTEVGLDVEDVELKQYAAAKTLQITTEVTGHAPENTTTIKATVVLDVDVNVGNALCGN